MKTPHIAFIGAGNMASSIIGVFSRAVTRRTVSRRADPFPQSLERLQKMAPIALYSDNAQAVATADIIILAVKPQVMAEATDSIAAAVTANSAVVLSIAAGVTIATMAGRLGEQAAIVRCMPNTPALLGCGASGLFANEHTSAGQREFAQFVLSAVGTTRWVETEQELDAITALSGSGPAYFFLFLEAMIDAGCELGLDRDTASQLALQTSLGASRMALENDIELTELRRRVTSPGGTTESAIASFEQDGLREVVSRAMRAAADRAAEMAREMG